MFQKINSAWQGSSGEMVLIDREDRNIHGYITKTLNFCLLLLHLSMILIWLWLIPWSYFNFDNKLK